VSREQSGDWFHGSPLALTVLREGSSITQRRDLARVFSHKPALVCLEDDGRILHNGTLPGRLYLIDEPLREGDVAPHPRTTMGPGDEWLTTRVLRLRWLEDTLPLPEELLNAADVEALRRRMG
jgi:hypothetical protein